MNENTELAIRNESEILTLTAYAQDFKLKMEICTMLWKSGVLPHSIKSPEAVFTLVMMGQEYGFSPIKSCELFDCIDGRACMRTQGLHAKALQNGGAFKVLKSSSIECEIKGTRTNRAGQVTWEETTSFNITQAKDAGLLSKSVWQKYPQDMLWNRCMSRLCKHGFADVLAGLDSYEDLRDLEAIDVTPKATNVEVLPSGSAPFIDVAQNAAAAGVFKDDEIPFSANEVSEAEPAPAPAPVEPEPVKVWYYDMNLSYRFLHDENFRLGTQKALAKKGKEVGLNVWEVSKEFSAIRECAISVDQLEKAIDEANQEKK